MLHLSDIYYLAYSVLMLVLVIPLHIKADKLFMILFL